MFQYRLIIVLVCVVFSTNAYAIHCQKDVKNKICEGNREGCTGPADAYFASLVMRIAPKLPALYQQALCDVSFIAQTNEPDIYAIYVVRNSGIRISRFHFYKTSVWLNRDSSAFSRRQNGTVSLNWPDDNAFGNVLSTPDYFLAKSLVHELAHHIEHRWLGDSAFRCTDLARVSLTASEAKLLSEYEQCGGWQCASEKWSDAALARLLQIPLKAGYAGIYAMSDSYEDFAESNESMFEASIGVAYKLTFGQEYYTFSSLQNLNTKAFEPKRHFVELLLEGAENDDAFLDDELAYDHLLCQGMFERENLMPKTTNN